MQQRNNIQTKAVALLYPLCFLSVEDCLCLSAFFFFLHGQTRLKFSLANGVYILPFSLFSMIPSIHLSNCCASKLHFVSFCLYYLMLQSCFNIFPWMPWWSNLTTIIFIYTVLSLIGVIPFIIKMITFFE